MLAKINDEFIFSRQGIWSRFAQVWIKAENSNSVAIKEKSVGIRVFVRINLPGLALRFQGCCL